MLCQISKAKKAGESGLCVKYLPHRVAPDALRDRHCSNPGKLPAGRASDSTSLGSPCAKGLAGSRDVRRMRSATGVGVPSCGATRKSRPVPSSLRLPRRLGRCVRGGPARRRDTSALEPPPPPQLLFHLPLPGVSPPAVPGGARCVSAAGLLPASAAAAAVAVPGSLPRCRDGDALLPGEGSEAERAAPAHPVQAAEGGGQQVLRRLRGQR